MERKRITCPESAHLEQIGFERTEHGIVITGCSGLGSPCRTECARECARRMDLRERRDLDDVGERVLVLYADGQAKAVAEQLAESLAADGLTAELANTGIGVAPSPSDYNAVVIGIAVRLSGHVQSINDYVVRHRDTLSAMPSYLFSVGRSADATDIACMTLETGWQPTRSVAFALARGLARWVGDDTVRTSGDASNIRGFALAIADDLPREAPPTKRISATASR